MCFRLYFFLLLFFTYASHSQVNNLQHIEGYESSEWGQLGDVQQFGSGDKNMILLPGWGFDWTIFKAYIEAHKSEYTFYAVTFPGFGKTQAPPMPAEHENYSDLYWTKGILNGLHDLIVKEDIENPILMSYFTYSNIIAMRMALDYPKLIDKIIIVSGVAKFTPDYPSLEPRTLEQRIFTIEEHYAKNWFKTVDQDTWNKGNFLPTTFTKDSLNAKKYWDQMSAVPVPVMVRYLCEFYCTDLSLEYSHLQVPVLVVVPTFTEKVYQGTSTAYFSSLFHHSWLGAKEKSDNIHIITLTDTHAFIFDDQPKKLSAVIKSFIKEELSPFDVFR